MIMYKMKPEIENDSQRMIDYPQEKENENGVVSRETDAQHAQVSVNVKEVKYRVSHKKLPNFDGPPILHFLIFCHAVFDK